MRGLAAVMLSVLLASALLLMPQVSDAAGDPQDDFPDADVIIWEDEGGNTLVTTRSDDGEGGYAYTTSTLRSGANLTAANLSSSDGDLAVVMTGGSVGTLTLLNADVPPDTVGKVDIEFTMQGGTVSSLLAVAVPTSVEGSLSSSYFTADGPVGSLHIYLAGDIGEVTMTEDMVGVDSLYLEVASGAEIDRLYPTGAIGMYGEVTVVLSGGHVGYMSNLASVVTYMDYDLRAGTIDYLCIGADTEGGRGNYLSAMWTFYVQRDFSLTCGPLMDVGRAVLGAGILSAPSILGNGEEPAVVLARNVIVDAPSLEVEAATCFLYSGGILRFSSYEIGGSPERGDLRTEYYQNYQRKPIYGDDGIWSSWLGAVVPAGVVLYSDADLVVSSDADLLVEAGGRIVNAGLIIVHGTLTIEGAVDCTGVIERRDSGSVVGEVTGTGLVATGITARPNDGRVDVMTVSEDAVVLRASDGDIYFNAAMVIFDRTDSVVEVEAPSSMYIGGTKFVVGLSEPTDGTWVLTLTDLGPDSGATVRVTIPGYVPSGYAPVVTDSDGNEMEIVSSSGGYVTFLAGGSGTYVYSVVQLGSDDADDGEGRLSPLAINVIIAAAIVIVAAVAVYFLLRRDRGPGPS